MQWLDQTENQSVVLCSNY